MNKAAVRYAIEDAERNRIAPADIPDALLQHRAGDPTATGQLRRGFEFLLWERFQSVKSTKRISRDEVLGTLSADLVTAIDRLARNSTPPDDVERYISEHLLHSVERYKEEITEDILPARHDGAGVPLKRTRAHEPTRWQPDPEQNIDPLENPNVTLPTDYRAPSKYQQSPNSTDEFEKLLPHCRTPLESNIVGLALAGHTLSDLVADLHGVSIAQVKRIIARLQRRAA